MNARDYLDDDRKYQIFNLPFEIGSIQNTKNVKQIFCIYLFVEILIFKPKTKKNDQQNRIGKSTIRLLIVNDFFGLFNKTGHSRPWAIVLWNLVLWKWLPSLSWFSRSFCMSPPTARLLTWLLYQFVAVQKGISWIVFLLLSGYSFTPLVDFNCFEHK